MSALTAYSALATATVLLGFAPSVLLMRKSSKNTLDWALAATSAGLVVLFALLAGSWHVVSHYLRAVAALLFFLALARSYVKLGKDRFIFSGNLNPGSVGINVRSFVIVAFAALNAVVLSGFFQPPDALNLTFPLKGGTYAVAQGGSNPITNAAHRRVDSQLYAVDIVALTSTGARAASLLPEELHAYAIYDSVVYSPCAGVVAAVTDDAEENQPGVIDAAKPDGNNVVLKCAGAHVTLAGLKKGSIAVKPADMVGAGFAVAKVGGTGAFYEPHLHVHAVRVPSKTADLTGALSSAQAKSVAVPLPLTFDGMVPTLNTIIKTE